MNMRSRRKVRGCGKAAVIFGLLRETTVEKICENDGM